MMITQVYASTTEAEEDVDEFYAHIQFEIDRISKQNVPHHDADWNAKVRNIKKKNVLWLHG